MAYYDFLDAVFGPLLNINPLVAVVIMALFISVLIIFITKFMTDQKLMKSLKENLKGHQKQIKELKSNPAKAMEVQKKAMELNMKYMMHSMKPTLITFIPIILIFGWMSAHFAFQPIQPQQDFSVSVIFDKNSEGSASVTPPSEISAVTQKVQTIENGMAAWTLKGKEGTHTLEFEYNNQTFYRDVIISSAREYAPALEKISSNGVQSIQINYKKSTLLPIGFKDWLGWLGVYIWSSIIFTTSLRKLFKVY
jgi:uncharacterized membrane protein (DUF106 family)